MTFCAVRSLPLSEETKQAWRAVGAFYPRRGSSVERIEQVAAGAEFILNLGSSKFVSDGTIQVWNQGNDIYPLLWPGMSRELFDDLMPPRPTTFPSNVWIKPPGRGGRGKYHLNVGQELVLPRQWDWQVNVNGREYRLITVGDKIVQQFHRHGDNEDRSYQWLPAEDTPSNIRAMAKTAASRVYGENVIAWDLILDGAQAYLFEGNTCPGMSEPTAQRIVDAIREYQEV